MCAAVARQQAHGVRARGPRHGGGAEHRQRQDQPQDGQALRGRQDHLRYR